MHFQVFIALRYLRSKRHQRSVSFISLATFLGIMIGVMTLITVLSVINGFQETIRDKIINTGYHVYLTSYKMDEYLVNHEDLIKTIHSYDPEIFATPFFKGQAIARGEGQRIIAVDLQGVDPDIYSKDRTLRKAVQLVEGKFSLDANGILIGQELAKFLALKAGQSIDIISPEGQRSPLTGIIMPQIQTFKINGIFKSGHYENDLKLVFVSLRSAQKLFNKPDMVWGIGIKIKDIFRADQMATKIKKILNYKYHTFSWMMYNHNFFVALKNEKAIMGFIVCLIMLVAGFNIASSLILLVIEKRRDIGVLLAMGAGHSQINSIFLLEGMMLGGSGVLIGTIMGILVSINIESIFHLVEIVVNSFITLYVIISNLFHFTPDPGRFYLLAPDVYYLDKLPVSIHLNEVLLIAMGALIITFISSWLSAKQASSVDPVEAIRYE